MNVYTYEDREGDRLRIQPLETSTDVGAYIKTNNGIGVYLPAAEAPKAAQAILDAAGVKGVLLTDLPEVKARWGGGYEAQAFTSYHQSDLTVMELELKALTAIWLQHKADKEAEGAKLTQQIKEAADFRANQARIEAENKAAEAKKAHDDLRTSPIALKALALYNEYYEEVDADYANWDEVNSGAGCSDDVVRKYIEQAEQEEAKEKEATEKLAARRDALAKELCDGTSIGPWYEAMGTVHKRAIDRIIELEDAK